MKIAELTVEELQVLIKQAVHEELQSLLGDPDQGLSLRSDIEAQLRTSLASNERIPFDEVKRKLQLH